MYNYEKLSEENLKEVLQVLFPEGKITPQKRIKLDRTYVIDYEVDSSNQIFLFEFDGPTHYTKSATQVRDIALSKYCLDNKIELVRIPYFVQANPYSIRSLFSEKIIKKHDLCKNSENLECDYACGFYDKAIILPGDYNSYGWNLFFKQYMNMAASDCFVMMREIYESLLDKAEERSYEHIFGVDYKSVQTKTEFIDNYPT